MDLLDLPLGRRSRVGALVLFLLATSTLALAQSSPLRLNLERFLLIEQEVEGETEEVRLPALELQPGDVMLESLTAENTSDAPLEGVALVVPVAYSTAYLEGTASRPAVGDATVTPEFSYDMGQTFAVPPLTRTIVVVEDGAAEEREVEVAPEEYTHVRWVLPSLSPEQTVAVSFRAIVE